LGPNTGLGVGGDTPGPSQREEVEREGATPSRTQLGNIVGCGRGPENFFKTPMLNPAFW